MREKDLVYRLMKKSMLLLNRESYQLCMKSRRRDYKNVRRLVMRVLRNIGGWPLLKIGAAFEQHHTTIMNSLEQIDWEMRIYDNSGHLKSSYLILSEYYLSIGGEDERQNY